MKNPVLLLIIGVFFVLTGGRFPIASALLSILYWRLRTGESVLPAVLLILVLAVPRWSASMPEVSSGTVREIGSGYVIVQNGEYRFLLYTEEELPLDSEIRFDPHFTPVTSPSGFFRFRFDQWCQSSGIFYSSEAGKITIEKDHFSIRRMIQDRIRQADEPVRELLSANLLNIRTAEGNSLYEGGFSFSGIFLLLDSVLKYILERKNRKTVMTLISFLFGIVFRFPALVLLYFISSVLSFSSFSRVQKTCFSLLLVMMIRPGCLYTVSFLFPAVLKLSSLYKDKALTFTSVMMIQSIFYCEMKPLQFFLYGAMKMISGILWLLSLIQLILIRCTFLSGITPLYALLRLTDSVSLPGSAMGIGLIFFLGSASLFRKDHRKTAVLLLVFQLTGLFHPFAEVTFINVGQGDSILIRMPLNTSNILIDTGKPTQEDVLRTFLKAKGIHRIQTLIITHTDDDHSGNQEMIINEYHPETVITGHSEEPLASDPVIYDLNQIHDEDENRSSVIQYFSLNGITYLLMADADEQTERSIIREFPSLQCDILKLSHHGSKSGSSDAFLDTVKPGLGIISSGSYSLYHHPSPEVLQRLLKRHIPWLDTKEEGDISVICFPGFSLLLTSEGKISVLR